MKVLIVRTYPNKLNIDSYNVQEVGLAKALIRAGHICDIVLYNGALEDTVQHCTFRYADKDYSYDIYWLKGYNFLKNGYMPSLYKVILNYDVIQVDEYDLLQSWSLYKRQIKPTVVYHGLYASKYTKGYNLKCKVFDTFFHRWYRYSNVVCATKSELASKFLRDKGFVNVHTVGVGLDSERFSDMNQSHVDKSDGYTILYVGKIEDRRNILFLIDVLNELLRRNINVKLEIIGNGEGDYLQRFLSYSETLRNSGKLIHIANVKQEDISIKYLKSDLFVFPSKYEIFGMVLLESMYFGCPVVTSYNGGSSILMNNNEDGVVVDDFDVMKWANEIETLLNDNDKRNKISENAKKLIQNDFLWDSLVHRFISLYEEAISINK